MVDQGEDGGSEREYLAGDGVRGGVISPVGVKCGIGERKETYHWKIRNLWRDSRNLRREI